MGIDIHSGSLPNSMAFKFPMIPLADFAAAMVFVISLRPRLSPSTYKRIRYVFPLLLHFRLQKEVGSIPSTTVPAYVLASFIKLEPNVNEAGASVGEATV